MWLRQLLIGDDVEVADTDPEQPADGIGPRHLDAALDEAPSELAALGRLALSPEPVEHREDPGPGAARREHDDAASAAPTPSAG